MDAKEVEAVVMKSERDTHQQDRHSILLDEFERLSFEIQLNQAILRRSLSEAAAAPSRCPPPLQLAPQVKGKRGWSKAATTPFRKAIKKLLRPFLAASSPRAKTTTTTTPTASGFASKRLSRSVRV